MAHARTAGAARDLPEGVRGTDSQGRCALRAGRHMEGPDLCRFHPAGGGPLRRHFGTLRTDRPTGPHHYRNGPTPGLLLLVVVRSALTASAAARDSVPADCSATRYRGALVASFSLRRGG